MKVYAADLLTSCAKPDQFPVTAWPEVAFLGRSNVGKSSLLNALVNRKKLARTSATPGKTRLIHFFKVQIGSEDLVLVDLPGYGWAKVSRRERNSWQQLIEGYLDKRVPLKAAVLLQDLRRDFTEDETLLLDWLAEREVNTIVALTKSDKFKPMRRKQRIAELKRQIVAPTGGIVATSSEKKDGLEDLWKAVHRLIHLGPEADDIQVIPD